MTTNFSKSREEMQLEDFCHALNRENNIIQDQLTEYKVKHEVACSTINLLQKKCDVRGKALSLQCKETKELQNQLAAALAIQPDDSAPKKEYEMTNSDLVQRLRTHGNMGDKWSMLLSNEAATEIESLRQKLTEKESQRQELMRAFERQGNSAQEVITELRQQLAAAQEEFNAERNRRFEGNRISSQEYNDCQNQVVMLRDALDTVVQLNPCLWSYEKAQKALAKVKEGK